MGLHPIRAVFEVSALEQLDGAGVPRDWAALVSALDRLNTESGREIVRAAASRWLRRLTDQLRAVVNEERGAMTRPFEASERRIQKLREVVSQAEQSLNDLGFLFSGEQQRLSKMFSDRRSDFLNSVRANAHNELDSVLSTQPHTLGSRYRRAAMRAAQDVARRHMMPWLSSEQQNAEQAYLQITKRFVELANDFLVKARNTGSAEMTHLPKELSFEQEFRTRSEFHFHEYVELASPASPLRYLADLILGILFAHSLIAAEAHEFLDRLLETNSERVRNDLENRVTESRRRLESEICAMLRELSAVAERALDRARTAHEAGTLAVESSLDRLAEIEDELNALTSNTAN